MSAEAPVIFDQDALKKRVSESVSSSFGMLIPAEQWQAMIDREVKAFFDTEIKYEFTKAVSDNRSSWSSGPDVYALRMGITPFRQMVWAKVQALCVAQIETILSSEKFMGCITEAWGSGSYEIQLNEVMEKKLLELAPKMAAEFFRTGFASALGSIKETIKQEIRENR